MKNIISAIVPLLLILALNACGNSDGENNESMIPIESCIEPAVISSYQVLNSGDIIVDETNTSIITTYHDSDNLKRVCLNSGQAYILRGEE
jgi:hypothetical protein